MDKNIKRNVPADEGRRNDPHVRDESAAQPGVNTMSGAPNDEANEELTKTASENFDTEVEAARESLIQNLMRLIMKTSNSAVIV